MLRPIDSCPRRRAAVGRFHDRRTAARADHEMPLAFLVAAAAAGQPRQLARDVVIMRLGLQPLGDLLLLGVGRGGDQRVGHVRRGNARRPVEDEGRPDIGFVEQQLGLQQLELEANRPQVLAQQELGVLERELVGRAFGLRDRRHMLGGAGVDLGSRENALGRKGLRSHRRRLAAKISLVTSAIPSTGWRPLVDPSQTLADRRAATSPTYSPGEVIQTSAQS